jgi:hypothetical protein
VASSARWAWASPAGRSAHRPDHPDPVTLHAALPASSPGLAAQPRGLIGLGDTGAEPHRGRCSPTHPTPDHHGMAAYCGQAPPLPGRVAAA